MGTSAQAQELQKVNGEIRRAEGAVATKMQAADELVGKLRSEGKEPMKDKELFAQVDAAYKDADREREHVKDLRARADALMADFSGSRTTASIRPAPMSLSEDDLRSLHEAATNRTPFRTSPSIEASVGLGQFDMAGRAYFNPTIAEILHERVRILDFIPWQLIDRPAVHWYRQTAPADAAAAVARGADKPESTPEWIGVDDDVVKIAHYAVFEDELQRDFGQWSNIVSAAMITGVIQAENEEILNGSGIGVHMTGLLQTDGILSVERDVSNDESRLDTLLRAIIALRTGAAFCQPTLTVLHPNDYYAMRVAKAVDSGIYLAGPPVGGGDKGTSNTLDLWEVPTVVTTTIAEGKGLVGNMPLATKGYIRDTPYFEVHPGGGGLAEWKANKTAVRAEERLLVTVEQPEALCEIDF